MAASLIAAICVPDVFGDLGIEFALAYGAVRFAQIFLLGIAGAIVFETRGYGEDRAEVRHGDAAAGT